MVGAFLGRVVHKRNSCGACRLESYPRLLHAVVPARRLSPMMLSNGAALHRLLHTKVLPARSRILKQKPSLLCVH